MSEDPTGRGHRPDPQPRLRIAALTAVITGVVLLAAAAFLLSYAGIHVIALQAGVSPSLARIYPLIFDAMLVIACAAVLALRGSSWWARAYVWLCLLLLLAGVATGDALHAMGVALPAKQARAAVAITPWALLLLAFGLLLAMLRHLRWGRLAAGRSRTVARPVPALAAGHVVTHPPGTFGAAPANGTAADGRPGAPPTAAGPAGWVSDGNTGVYRTVPPPRGKPGTPLDQGGAHPPGTAGDKPEPAAEKPRGQPPATGQPGPGQPGTGQPGASYPVGAGDAYAGDGDYDTDDYTDQGSCEPAEYFAEIADDAPAAGVADAPGQGGAADTGDAPGLRERPAGPEAEEPAEAARDEARDEGAAAEPAAPAGPGGEDQAGSKQRTGDTGSEGGQQDGAGADPGNPAPPVPAPGPIPHFDRLRSSPTPPQE